MWGETSRKDVKGGWGEEEKEPGSNELDATRYGSGPKRIIIITSLQPFEPDLEQIIHTLAQKASLMNPERVICTKII